MNAGRTRSSNHLVLFASLALAGCNGGAFVGGLVCVGLGALAFGSSRGVAIHTTQIGNWLGGGSANYGDASVGVTLSGVALIIFGLWLIGVGVGFVEEDSSEEAEQIPAESASSPSLNPLVELPSEPPGLTLCGSREAEPASSIQDWTEWTCELQSEVDRAVWAHCVGFRRYAADGGGCDGEARCCPPSLASVAAHESAIREYLPTLCGRGEGPPGVSDWDAFRCRDSEGLDPYTRGHCLGRTVYSDQPGTGCTDGMLCCP